MSVNNKSIKLNSWGIFLLTAAFGAMLFTGCDNEDPTPEVISVKDVEGDYVGKMIIANIEPNVNEGGSEDIVVSAKIANDTVYFDEFPVDQLVTLIMGEDIAPGFIEEIGKVSYKVGYKSTLTSDHTKIELVFDPKPLEINIEISDDGTGVPEIMPLKIEVTVSALEKGVYAYDGKNLQFRLSAEKVALNGDELTSFLSQDLNFNMTKQ